MANFEEAVTKTIVREGGAKVVNDPHDTGGLTKYGISQRAYPNEDIANLSEERAKAIYKKDYWDRVQGDQIKSQDIAEQLFDTAVNMGPRTASRLGQLALDIEPADGIIGPQSLEVINKAPRERFVSRYTLAKIARYAWICNNNPSQKKFLLGWINRSLGMHA